MVINLLLLASLGACIGSFSSMLMYRLPLIKGNNSIGLSYPRSHCPQCKSQLKIRMLIPIFSYIFQTGKCASCKNNIGIAYFLNEIIHVVAILFVWMNFGFTIEACVHYLIFSIFNILFFLDLKYLYLPLLLNTSLIAIGLLTNFAMNTFAPIEEALVGLIAGYSSLWLINKAFKLIKNKDGIGGGDFILLGGIGSIFGIYALGPIVFLGSSISIVIFILSGSNKDDEIPLGSGLILGSIIFYLIKTQLI